MAHCTQVNLAQSAPCISTPGGILLGNKWRCLCVSLTYAKVIFVSGCLLYAIISYYTGC